MLFHLSVTKTLVIIITVVEDNSFSSFCTVATKCYRTHTWSGDFVNVMDESLGHFNNMRCSALYIAAEITSCRPLHLASVPARSRRCLERTF